MVRLGWTDGCLDPYWTNDKTCRSSVN